MGEVTRRAIVLSRGGLEVSELFFRHCGGKELANERANKGIAIVGDLVSGSVVLCCAI